jgi:hypothetical protein
MHASPAQDEIARQLQARTRGRWLCWYGHRTGRYWAIRTGQGPFRLVEGPTPKDLAIAMGEVDAFYGGQSRPGMNGSATSPDSAWSGSPRSRTHSAQQDSKSTTITHHHAGAAARTVTPDEYRRTDLDRPHRHHVPLRSCAATWAAITLVHGSLPSFAGLRIKAPRGVAVTVSGPPCTKRI